MAALRVFLSHSHKDNAWCDGFVAELKHYGLDVWYDREGLYVGAQWVQTLEKELQERDIYLIVVTPDAWTSQWVRDELSLALGQRKHILGVLCKPTRVSGFLTNYQLLDVIRLTARQAAQKVTQALTGSPPVAQERKPFAPPQGTFSPLPQVAAGQAVTEVSGTWKVVSMSGESLHFKGMVLQLAQVETSITGRGTITTSSSGHLEVTIAGATERQQSGVSVHLTLTPLSPVNPTQFEVGTLNLTCTNPDEMRGTHQLQKRWIPLIKTSSETSTNEITLKRSSGGKRNGPE
jgi:hypothetical protein